MAGIATAAAGRVPLTAEIGRSALQQAGGYILEEYDSDLRGVKGVRIYDEMRKSDPLVSLGLRAIKWVIGQVSWTPEPAGETPADREAAEFVQSCMDDMSLPWSQVVQNALTCLEFGWSYNEVCYKLRRGSAADPASLFDDSRIGWRKIVLIGHQSLNRWVLADDGGIEGLVQTLSRGGEATIPIEKSLLFRLDVENNNPEGVSLLRSIYLPWYKRRQLEEIEAIGAERDLTGVAKITLPIGATQDDWNMARNILEQYHVDDMSGFILPRIGEGDANKWDVDIIGSPGSKGIDTDKIIQRYAYEIARGFMAQFLLLGQAGGSAGSWALAREQTDLFYTAIGTVLHILTDVFNRYLIPPLFRLNDLGQLTALPVLRPGRLGRQDLESFSKALLTLQQAALLTPDQDLEKYVREQFQLPAPAETAEDKPEPEETGEEDGGEGEKGQPAKPKPTEPEREATEPEPGQPTEADEEPDGLDVPDPYTDDEAERIRELIREISGGARARIAEVVRRFASTPDPSYYVDLIDQARTRSEGRMADLTRQFREGRLKYNDWVERAKKEIQDGVRIGHQLGVAQAQGRYPPWSVVLTPAQRMDADRMIGEQLRYFLDFRGTIREQMAQGKAFTTALDARAKLYAGAVRSASEEARLRTVPTARLRWTRHKDDSCPTCVGNAGQVKTASEWTAGGVWPAHGTQCDGHCGCSLHPVGK